MSQKFGTRRQKAKEETRRVILETAYELFEQKGFQKTTMRDLAAKAGVGLGTIFQHFPDKSMLAVAAFEDDMEAEVEKAFATLPQTSLKERLLHFACQFYTLYSQRPQLFRVVLNEIFLKNKETEEKIDGLIYSFWNRLGKLFQEAIDAGEIRPDIDISIAVMAYWAYYSQVLYIGLRMPVFNVPEQLDLLRKLIDQHFQGLEP